MYYMIAGFIAFILIFLYTRNIDSRNLKLLEKDEISVLIDIMAGLRKYTLWFLALLVVGFLLLSQFPGIPKKALLIGYAILLTIYFVVVYMVRMSKLRKAGLPEAFLRDHKQSSLLNILGQALLLLAFYMQISAQIQ